MRVCFVASEIVPFSKTGGLADVVGALCSKVAENGVEVVCFTPLYTHIDRDGLVPVEAHPFSFHLGNREVLASLWRVEDGSGARIFFVDCPEFFSDRPVYTTDWDEALRFAALCHVTLQACQHLRWAPDIFHCHDWQTGLLPLYVRSEYAWDRQIFGKSRTLLTIHNLGYQGIFSAELANSLISQEFISRLDGWDLGENRVNLLKTGIIHSDYLTTVSPTYAREIQSSEFGSGLDGLLRSRASSLKGILNGVDYDTWSPESDTHIARHFSVADSAQGKVANRRALLKELGMPVHKGVPVAAIISRLVWQKGIELMVEALPSFLETGALQFVALGSGEARYERALEELAGRFPRAVSFVKGYDPGLAHRIEAGADIFLMPSRYEPCGLNQMYSLRYGTIPVVRRTGGLADTVSHFNPDTRTGTGFVFEHFSVPGLTWGIEQALSLFPHRSAWKQLMKNAMSADFSWDRQVGLYLDLYRQLIEA